MHIKIEWTSDEHDCETCGWSYASGANIYFDDELAIELVPIANHFGGQTYTNDEVYTAILEKLGHTISDTL